MFDKVEINYFSVFRLTPVYLLLILIFGNSVFAHVSLTYPPARKYDLDFLDNIRTKPPCGQPKGNIGTTLVAGSVLNITWHLAYPHRGGYRLELLDKEEKFLLDLRTGKSTEEYVKGDPTAQWHTVTVPKDLICEDCTIRLLRQASEWANAYRFWSCADVKIVNKDSYKEDCLGHGKSSSDNSCKCDTGYWGPRCQYEDECDSDSDCGKGKCIDLGGTSLPRKQCFCSYGYHGQKCDKSNKEKLPNQNTLQLESYTKEELSNKMSVYYKMIKPTNSNEKEIEFVLVVNGTSYGAIGWRPASLNKTCKLWPHIQEDKEKLRKVRHTNKKAKMYIPNPTLLKPLTPLERSMAEPQPAMRQRLPPKDKLQHSKDNDVLPSRNHKPFAEPEPKPESEPESEPNPEAEPKSEPESVSEPEPDKSIAEPEKSAAEPEPEKSIAEPEKSAAEPEPEKSAAEPEPEKSIAEPEKSAAEPEPEKSIAEPEKSAAEPEPEKSAAEPEPEKSIAEPEKSAAEPEPEKSAAEPEPERSLPETEPKSEPESKKGHTSHPEPESKPEHDAEPEPEHHHDSSSEPEPSSASEPEPEGESESEPKNHHDSSSEPEPESSNSQMNSVYNKERKQSPYSPKGDFHAMDCVDIVMGATRGELSRIRDYYTRDRSTPKLDTFWGGSDDLTSSTGWEIDGTTYLIFRRKVSSLENTDHSITGQMHVIWARGQQQGKYVHSPKSGIEVESPSVPNFYSEDEIKYHGHKDQRGVTYIDFPE